jgi:hypothetical protein
VAAEPRDARHTLERYARDTWASFVAMTDETTGLPADRLHLDSTRSVHDFAIYTAWGFRDSANVDTGVVSPSYLALDQGMIMAALGNALAQDMLREAFVTPEFRRALLPVIAVEAFNAGPPAHAPDLVVDRQP